jgi:hypothetical protein
MRLELVEYACGACRTRFKAPAIPAGAYGDFLLRNQNSEELRSLAAWHDPTFEEVDQIISASGHMAAQDARRRASILMDIFGPVVCDPDQSGNLYKIGLCPKCPFCSARPTSFLEVPEPVQHVDIEVLPVSHVGWDSLSSDEKRGAVFARLAGICREDLPAKPNSGAREKAYFHERDLQLIEALQYDPDLTPGFESIKSCLVWRDECPDGLTPDGYEKLSDLLVARSFIHQGRPFTSWTLAPELFGNAWSEAYAANFRWPGFNRIALSAADQEYLNACLADGGNI